MLERRGPAQQKLDKHVDEEVKFEGNSLNFSTVRLALDELRAIALAAPCFRRAGVINNLDHVFLCVPTQA